jgi:hypothetical protein
MLPSLAGSIVAKYKYPGLSYGRVLGLHMQDEFGKPEPTPVKTEALLPVVHAASANIRRAVDLAGLPFNAFFAGQLHRQIVAEAHIAVDGQPFPSDLDASIESERFASFLHEYLARKDGSIPLKLTPLGVNAADVEEGWGDKYDAMLIIMMQSQLIAMWTAFETFAGDLWEAAVNSHPHGLAKLMGKPVADKKPDLREVALAEEEPAKASEKSMRVEFLERHNYNVSGVMGTIWRRERFNFQILGSIRDAYAQAFHKDHDAIRQAICDESITSLSAVRNVLVHNAGIVDGPFEKAVKGIKRFASAERRKPLPIDGILVSDLILGVVEKMAKLAKAVDGWLQSHPEAQDA